MQSRTFTVKGRAGADRPMFIGGWTDDSGRHRTRGMADYLLTPQIVLPGPIRPQRICVPLWVECKAGRDALSQDQMEFRDFVTQAGAFWICCKNSCAELLEWFRDCKVVRR
jgi:hypothetical protein